MNDCTEQKEKRASDRKWVRENERNRMRLKEKSWLTTYQPRREKKGVSQNSCVTDRITKEGGENG